MRKRKLPKPPPTPEGMVYATANGKTILIPIRYQELMSKINLGHYPTPSEAAELDKLAPIVIEALKGA